MFISKLAWDFITLINLCDCVVGVCRFVDTMLQVCGPRQTELCCQKGLMLLTDQANDIGLIDDVATVEVIQAKAENEMKSWLKVPGG